MNMQCPQCGSTEFTKLSLVYAHGFSDLEARSRGWGVVTGDTAPDLAFVSVRTKGELRTRLSQQVSPPRKKRYKPVLLIWLLEIFIGAWFLGYMATLNHRSDAVFETQFTWFAYIYSGFAVFVLAVFWRFNHRIFPAAVSVLGPLVHVPVLRPCHATT
ncbi:MAG TPA: hypothetical protein VMI06_11655 [Terriglobia bacterium]|nr:hypothetical protein [Terriglobia bacterium]